MSEKIVQLNEEIIKGQIKELVRGSVEETLNELLEKEAESLTQAARYERSEARQGYRSGHYDRNLTTTSGDVTLHMPRLKGVSFETAIIERYRRRESSVEEALIEMYLAGVSVRRVEDITEALWGSNPVLTVAPPKEDSEMNGATNKITALYCRLSQEDERAGESLSIENQELICKGWFLPSNTYDCGSFVVNGTAVVGKEPEKPYNRWKSTQKGADSYEISI